MLAALGAVCAGVVLMGFFLGALLGGTLLLGAESGTVEPPPVLAALQNERGYVAADLIVAAPVSDSGNEIAEAHGHRVRSVADLGPCIVLDDFLCAIRLAAVGEFLLDIDCRLVERLLNVRRRGQRETLQGMGEMLRGVGMIGNCLGAGVDAAIVFYPDEISYRDDVLQKRWCGTASAKCALRPQRPFFGHAAKVAGIAKTCVDVLRDVAGVVDDLFRPALEQRAETCGEEKCVMRERPNLAEAIVDAIPGRGLDRPAAIDGDHREIGRNSEQKKSALRGIWRGGGARKHCGQQQNSRKRLDDAEEAITQHGGS